MAMELLRLDGKVAIVTGGGRGVGKSITLVMAEAGAKVVTCSRSVDQLEATVREIEAAGGEALAVRADITDPKELAALVDRTLDKYGQIDCLVNNAGGNRVVQVECVRRLCAQPVGGAAHARRGTRIDC